MRGEGSPGAAMLIPARGGSKSIPRKNIRPFAGKPLIFWLASAAQDCPLIDRIVVATDDEEIAGVCSAFGLSKLEIYRRSAPTATDSASTESLLDELVPLRTEEVLLLGQCTSPFTTSADLSAALAAFHERHADSLLTVARQKRFFWAENPDGTARPLNYDPMHRPRRQDFAGQLVENGAFYIFRREGYLQARCRLHGRMLLHEMADHTLLEIDEPSDWLAAEQIFRQA